MIFIVLVLIIYITTPEFRTVANFINILKSVSVIGIISCGMTLLLISGCLDLSVGSVFSLLNVIAISFQQRNNVLGIVLPLVTAVIIGLFNGLIVTSFDINSIIVTLGSLSFFAGLALLYTNGAIIFGIPDTWFSIIGKSRVLNVPLHVIIFLSIVIIYQILYTETVFGRKITFIGTNARAARIAGIRTGRIQTTGFIISSLSVAVAVLIYSSRMGTGTPISGIGYEFDAITAIVIGGTSLSGGKGNIFRTLIGVLMLAVIINVLTLYDFSFSYQSIAKGLLILIAMVADVKLR
jgi:inositol transport system permease protein